MNLMMSAQIQAFGKRRMFRGVMLRYIGVFILMTCFSFNDRASLWKHDVEYKYVPAANFGSWEYCATSSTSCTIASGTANSRN